MAGAGHSLTNASSAPDVLVGTLALARALIEDGDSVTGFDDYHGIHPAPPRPNAMAVQWSTGQSRAPRIRVRAHTCECSSLLFEQCMAGGLGFVRRYDRSVWPAVVVESPWAKIRDTEMLWLRIMRGEAR